VEEKLSGRSLVVTGITGFTIPLYLSLVVIRRMEVQNFAVLLFLLPAVTYVFSVVLGLSDIRIIDCFGALFIVAAVIMYERLQTL
jgi:threonine/homoserine efflux transporter RhtA